MNDRLEAYPTGRTLASCGYGGSRCSPERGEDVACSFTPPRTLASCGYGGSRRSPERWEDVACSFTPPALWRVAATVVAAVRQNAGVALPFRSPPTHLKEMTGWKPIPRVRQDLPLALHTECGPNATEFSRIRLPLILVFDLLAGQRSGCSEYPMAGRFAGDPSRHDSQPFLLESPGFTPFPGIRKLHLGADTKI